MPAVAIVTCSRLPDLYDDDRPLLELLAARGVDAAPVVWDDPAADWSAFDLAVLRNPWDYWSQLDRFLAWTRTVPRLANSADVVAWNTDKRYLADLAAAGVPVVPTTFVDPGDDLDAVDIPGGDVVVKPTVGAGAYDAFRFADRAGAVAHLAAITGDGRSAMVQPYLHAVDVAGETAVVFLGGEHSHGARKGPLLPADGPPILGPESSAHMSPRDAAGDEIEVARAALAAVPGDLLYGRVDLLRDGDGRPVVLEVEVTEPALFLDFGEAHARFADAIAARAGADRS